MLISAKIAVLCSQIIRTRPVSKVKNMNKGISQSTWFFWRASSKPLAESRRVKQLTWSHGKKKQNRTNPAELTVTCRTAPTLHPLSLCVLAYSCYASLTIIKRSL
jgi:hypothetical protein